MTREYTIKLLEEMDEGLWDAKQLVENLTQWMSEHEVKEFYEFYWAN